MDFEKAGAQTASTGLQSKELKYEESFLPQDCENLLGRVMAGALLLIYLFIQFHFYCIHNLTPTGQSENEGNC